MRLISVKTFLLVPAIRGLISGCPKALLPLFSPVGADLFPYRGRHLPLQGKIHNEALPDIGSTALGLFLMNDRMISDERSDDLHLVLGFD